MNRVLLVVRLGVGEGKTERRDVFVRDIVLRFD